MPDHGFLVVARYADGRIIRGTTSDFRPGRAFFHVLAEDTQKPVRVLLSELKAIFYVKTLFGDHTYVETNTFRYRRGFGRKVWVKFLDGECLAGWATAYTPEKGGFYLFPTDANSNAERAFIVNEAVAEVLLDEEAETAADARAEAGEGGESGPPSVRPLRNDEWNDMLGIEPSGPPGAARKPPRPRSKSRDSGMFLGDW